MGSQEEFFCFVDVLRNTMSLHEVDAHPVSSDDITLFSGNHVVVASPCFVAFNIRLGSAELGESASSTARLCLINALFKASDNLLDRGVFLKSDIVVGLVLEGGQMVVVDGLLDPLKTFLFVAGNSVGEGAFNLVFAERVAGVISQFCGDFLMNEGFEVGLVHNFKFSESGGCAHGFSFKFKLKA